MILINTDTLDNIRYALALLFVGRFFLPYYLGCAHFDGLGFVSA